MRGDLGTDNRTTIDVPIQILGNDYITVNGTTRVSVENYAFPRLAPSQLLVSDYPETAHRRRRALHRDDRPHAVAALLVLSLQSGHRTRAPHLAQGDQSSAARRPSCTCSHRLRARARTRWRSGHNATKGFLIRARRNEGTVVTIPPNSTVNIVNHNLPPNAIVNGILQLREITGDPLAIALIAQARRCAARSNRRLRNAARGRRGARARRRIRCRSSFRNTRSTPMRRRSRFRSANCRCRTCAKAKRSRATTA